MKKKNILKVLSGAFSVALLLTGCATVGNVKDKSGKDIYFDSISYNQGQVVQVGDYLYYGNGYSNASDSSFSYSTASKTGYLARLNTSGELEYTSSVKNENKQNTSPKAIEKVNDKLVGYEKQNMFALGSYLYFTSANTHKTSSLENDYTQVSLFRVKFNGDKFEEIGTFKTDDGSFITANKGSDNNYYYIISEPSSDSQYNLYSIKIGDGKIGDKKTLAEDVLTAVASDENSSEKNIVYTKTSEDTEITTTKISSVDFATAEVATLDNGTTASETKLLGRSGDVVFYSYKSKGITEVYYKNISTDDGIFNPTPSYKFYNAESIKNIQSAGNGYIFVSNTSNSLMYKTLDSTVDAVLLLSKNDFSDVMFVDGEYVYYSNSTSISRISVTDLSKETIVTMTDIVSGKCGYTGEYIYYYAKLEKNDSEEDDSANNNDTNYYMYRTDKQGNYTLVGKTK